MKVEGNPYSDVFTLNNQYIVRFKELTDNKMVVGDLELQVDTRYNQGHYASQYGIVMATNENDIIKVGDKLSLQYLVVEEKNNIHRDNSGYYNICDRDQVHFVMRGKNIIMLDKFVLIDLEQTDSSEYEENEGGLLMPKAEVKGKERTGMVISVGDKVDNVEIGDRVKLHKSAPYPLDIDGKRYYRVRADIGILFKYKK